MFTSVHSGVTTQIIKKATFFMLTIHCVTHQRNPTMQTFFMQPLVHKLEGLLQATYTYFSFSPKRHLVLFVLACTIDKKKRGNKLLCNVKTRWISMLSLTKRVIVEYKSLVVKTNDDLEMIKATKPTLEFLCDVEVVLGLICIMPMLEVVHDLIKFAQNRDTFVCDFVRARMMCCANLHTLYYDPKKNNDE